MSASEMGLGEWPVQEAYRPVVIKPGDKIIVEVADESTSSEVCARIKERLSAAFPDHEVFVIVGCRVIVVERPEVRLDLGVTAVES